jgi:2',3'-cyclic-nucleotide 2'-phosphodiesterase (5'-nucleotidase family)
MSYQTSTAINKYSKELRDHGVETIVVLAHEPGTSVTNTYNPTQSSGHSKVLDPDSGATLFLVRITVNT